MIRLLDLLKKFTGSSTASVNGKNIDEAIEHVIDSIDARLRLAPSYNHKLKEAVAAALQHIDHLVDQVPGPFNFSSTSYLKDANVSAYFASPTVMQETFSNSSELKSYYSDVNNIDSNSCYALLCSNKEEKTIVGSELVDGIVRNEVMQTAINFLDYKVLSPANSDCEVRKGIKQCIFDGLITHALQHIASIKVERRSLQDQQRILNAKLRARQSAGNGLSAMLAEGHAYKESSDEIKIKLQQASKKMETMLEKKDVLSFYLDQVSRILSSPEDFIQLNVACFRLSNMRIKVSDDSAQMANTVCFSELEIANVMKRVVAVASFSRDEMKLVH